MARILRQQILYAHSHFHAAFPSIARFSDGNLLLAFRRARNGNWLLSEEKLRGMDLINRMDHIDSRSHIVMFELDQHGDLLDGMDTLPFDPEAGDQDPSLLILPDDKVFLAAFSWYPLPADAAQHIDGKVPPGEDHPGCRFLFWGAHSSLRERAGGSWLSTHRYILPDGGFGYSLSPGDDKKIAGSVRGQPLFKDGKLYLALYAGSRNDAALFISGDLGETWRFSSTIACDPEGKIAFQEPALCHDGKGGFVCFLRTTGAEGRLATSHSPDGVDWSEPVLHDLVGHPFNPLQLSDGRIFLSYGYRYEPFGIRARLLEHALQDPDQAEEIIIRDDGPCADIGYPWAVQLTDSQIMVVYYFTAASGLRQVEGTWLEI